MTKDQLKSKQCGISGAACYYGICISVIDSIYCTYRPNIGNMEGVYSDAQCIVRYYDQYCFIYSKA